jgi:6-phosphogluconolactonase
MFDALARSALPWAAIDIFQVDERVVDPDDSARNWKSLTDRLLDPAQVPASKRHPMRVESTDLPAAARAYGHEIEKFAPRGVDVVHLGLGDDGHTASWPPGDPVINSTDPVSVVGPFRGYLRLTITPVIVNRAMARLWLISGQDKQQALRLLRTGDMSIPAAVVVQTDDDVLVCDPEAVA